MDLKNATAVCLISFVSAALVVLVARALDLQAASKVEPQLAKIAAELQALRSQGGIAPMSAASVNTGPLDDGVMVYYFHSKIRCATCQAIESQSRETVQAAFASGLESGEIVWKVLNYEDPEVAELAGQFKVQMPVVVVARMSDGEIAEWKRLDQVWALVGDEPAFSEFIQSEIRRMLQASDSQAVTDPGSDDAKSPIPVPGSVELPVPETPPALPVPE